MEAIAGVVELVDSLDLGSNAKACRFESCRPHQKREALWGLSFLVRMTDSNRFNADARWASACRRFSGGNSVRGEAEAIEGQSPREGTLRGAFFVARMTDRLGPIQPGKMTGLVGAVMTAPYEGCPNHWTFFVGDGFQPSRPLRRELDIGGG